MAQLAFDADCLVYPRANGAIEGSSVRTCGEELVEALLDVAEREQVEVSILLNATLLLDTTRPLRRFLTSARARGIRLRGTSRFPQLLHAKIVIIDGAEAFLLGSPFVNGYWDDKGHRPIDLRRPRRELGGRPLHDVSLRITGPAVGDLDAMFCEMWNDVPVSRGGRDDMLQPHRAPMTSRQCGGTLRVVRTLPQGGLPSTPHGTTEILDACLEGIARARSLIYIEHQYLSARPVVAALAAALRRLPTLEIVTVLNQNPDVTAYRTWQNARLAESGLLEHPRFGVFALWNVEPQDDHGGRMPVNQVFVHSKVLVVDDTWATLGSANLDGVSLHSYGDDFDGRLGRRLFRGVRNFDINIVVDDRIDGVRRGGPVADLRKRLWSEHLGMPEEDVPPPDAGMSLALWRQRAANNVAALNGDFAADHRPRCMRGFVLPYSLRPRPADQLADLGVRSPRERLDLRFDPGWLEIHFSPNWVRNMFP
jgi:phosphatidylserine/phosphatidylglycerophosphate/cardiolipin synthase-like enzyme